VHDLIAAGGGPAEDESLARWEARAEHTIGVLIRRFLAQNPPPAPSRVAQDLQTWSHALAVDGRARLQELGEDHLHLADPDQEA
jgi:uncharacterized protein (DUF1800 family)